MKNCDAHGALFQSEKQLAQDEGYLISAAYMKKTSIYTQFLERDRAVIESLGLTMQQYRAQMDVTQGNSPWMVCEECVKELHLSAEDLERARKAALLWESDKSTPGITPSPPTTAAPRERPRTTGAQNTTPHVIPPATVKPHSAERTGSAVQQNTFLDSTPLLIALFVIRILAYIVFAQLLSKNMILASAVGLILDGLLIFACFMMVRKSWKTVLLVVIIFEMPGILSTIGSIVQGAIRFSTYSLLAPIISILSVLGMVWIGKKVVESKEKPMTVGHALILSVIIPIVAIMVNMLFVYVLRFSYAALSLLVAWLAALLVYRGTGKKPQSAVSSFTNQAVIPPNRDREAENIFKGSDEEAMKKMFDRLNGK